MLLGISIKNYALIDNINIDFSSGMTSITGETGAGKSIILGALRLVLGGRADLKSISSQEEKCIIEAQFSLNKEQFLTFFDENDVDFEETTIIRREILPSGKSRAFINDTPTTLEILQKLSTLLIDIHSQFETSNLLTEKFQLKLLDNFSKNQELLEEYQKIYKDFIQENKKLEQLKEDLSQGTKDIEYNTFLLNELEPFDFENINLEELEKELKLYENSEFLAQIVSESKQLIDAEEIGIQPQFNQLILKLEKAEKISEKFKNIYQRLENLKYEIQDISSILDDFADDFEFNPNSIEILQSKVNTINSLLIKHRVLEVSDLQQIKNKLQEKNSDFSQLEEKITRSELRIKKLTDQLLKYAKELHAQREKNSEKLENKIIAILSDLGMDKSKMKITLSLTEDFIPSGTDKIEFLFSANVGHELVQISKAISGGERSRVMLAIKKVMAENENLPTLILDEIDSGVSGRIANEMGRLMQQMAKSMQLIVISHLPQVAAKGDEHYKVEKRVIENKTVTTMKKLSKQERINEIAQLISGSDVTETAVKQALDLFK